jgi:hypothetical protein
MDSLDFSHDIKTQQPQRGRQIIARLTRRNDLMKVFKAKKILRDDKNVFNTVYINEDLTRQRHMVLQRLLAKKREGRIIGAWRYQGRIFYRIDENGRPIRVPDYFEFNPDYL